MEIWPIKCNLIQSKDICDRVCIKGPHVGNLKNEIGLITFYVKTAFIASVPLISERNFPAEDGDVKILKFKKWLPNV